MNKCDYCGSSYWRDLGMLLTGFALGVVLYWMWNPCWPSRTVTPAERDKAAQMIALYGYLHGQMSNNPVTVIEGVTNLIRRTR